MNIPVLSQLIYMIEAIFKAHGSTIAQAAGEAAAQVAVATVEEDPKVKAVTEASVAFLAAAKVLKTAIDEHADANAAPASTEPPAAQ